MDMYSAIVVVVPIIVPLGMAYGVDPLHLGLFSWPTWNWGC